MNMNRRMSALLCVSALSLLGVGPVAVAQQEHKPDMHMHKSELAHRPDKEVAAEYKSEATQLRDKAQLHRGMAAQYRKKTPHKSGVSYESVARHCDQLAQSFDAAAKEADDLATELAK
jgi:hypothetical protein